MGCITPANGPIRLPRGQKLQTYAVAIIVYPGHAETTGHGRQPCRDAANAADSENWRCDTGTLYADLHVSAVSVVPAGGYLAYQGSPTGDTASIVVDIPRAILAVSRVREYR